MHTIIPKYKKTPHPHPTMAELETVQQLMSMSTSQQFELITAPSPLQSAIQEYKLIQAILHLSLIHI